MDKKFKCDKCGKGINDFCYVCLRCETCCEDPTEAFHDQ